MLRIVKIFVFFNAINDQMNHIFLYFFIKEILNIFYTNYIQVL